MYDGHYSQHRTPSESLGMNTIRPLAIALLPAFALAAPAADEVDPVSTDDFVAWVRDNAIHLDTLDWQAADLAKLSVLDRLLEGKRVVYLGEPDHYIREKIDFRLVFIRYLFERGWRHIGMEMGYSDAKRVEKYLQTGDTSHLDRVATLGYRGDLRPGRKHTLRGLTGEQNKPFWKRAWDEHRWFLAQLRSLNESRPENAPRLHWFGYDVDTRPGGGYTDARELLKPHRSNPLVRKILQRLARVDDESRAEEINRLESLLTFIKTNERELQALLTPAAARELERTLTCLTDGFAFLLAAVDGLGSPQGIAGLRRREQCMFRYMDEYLADLEPGDKIILLGHNMHLSKDSDTLLYGPIDSLSLPMWTTIGTHVANRLPNQVFSIWLLYDHGRHARLMRETIIEKDVPTDPGTVEHTLAMAGSMYFLPLHTNDPREAYLHQPLNFRMNARPVGARLTNQADAIFFVAEAHEPARRSPSSPP
jgi:erythromycin esterase-like protein